MRRRNETDRRGQWSKDAELAHETRVLQQGSHIRQLEEVFKFDAAENLIYRGLEKREVIDSRLRLIRTREEEEEDEDGGGGGRGQVLENNRCRTDKRTWTNYELRTISDPFSLIMASQFC